MIGAQFLLSLPGGGAGLTSSGSCSSGMAACYREQRGGRRSHDQVDREARRPTTLVDTLTDHGVLSHVI